MNTNVEHNSDSSGIEFVLTIPIKVITITYTRNFTPRIEFNIKNTGRAMKLPFKISIKIKIALFIVFLVIIMMGTVTYIFTIRELNLRVDQMKLQMERLANNIATIRSVDTEDWQVYQTYIDNQLKVNPDIIYIAVFDENKELKVHALNTDWIDLDDGRLMDHREQANIVWQLDQRQIAVESQQDIESKSVNIIISGQNVGTVNVGFSLVELNDEMRNNLYRNLNLAFIFIALAVVISLFMSQRIIKPLGKLTKAMLKISEGDLQQELHLTSHDEIGEMAKTFNFMTKGLKEKAVIENFSRELGFTIDFQKMSSLIANHITRALNGKKGFLFIRDKKETRTYRLVGSYPESSTSGFTLDFETSVYDMFSSNRNPKSLIEVMPSVKSFEKLSQIAEFSPYALLCPIVIQSGMIGLFLLDGNEKSTPYTEEEVNFLNTLIGQSGFAVENALLLEELTEQERMKHELEIARRVQRNLLPQNNPTLSGLDIDGICIPAAEVGGDYFDYFSINNHTLGIVIADVTSKGTSAAFYMAVVKGMMLSLTSIHSSPKKLLIDLNCQLYGVMDRNMFVTMTYAAVDMKKKNLTFARAGHNALIVRDTKKASVDYLTPSGIGLGLEKGNKFDKTIIDKCVPFKAGDTFVFYTDGISEAMNPDREEFGEERLSDIIARTDHQSAMQIKEDIVQAVHNFANNAPQHDDITMVILRAI